MLLSLRVVSMDLSGKKAVFESRRCYASSTFSPSAKGGGVNASSIRFQAIHACVD